MNYSISIAFLLLLSHPGKTQNSHLQLRVLPTQLLRLKKTAGPLANPCPFSRFGIVDQRPDTARLGIHNENVTFGRAENVQMVLKTPVSTDLASWLNEHFARPDAPYTALIVLRGLWLCDANYLRQERINNPEILYDRTHIRLKAEIYAVRDSDYIPILRFDSLLTYKRYNPYRSFTSYYTHWENDLSAMLGDMIDSVSGLAAARIEKGRRLRLEDILEFNHSRFDAPIAGAATLNPGVYANFDEFRKNTPSIQSFEVRVLNKDHVLYTKDASGSLYFNHDAWGYCDGKNIFIMRDGILLPLWREGNAFYFQGLSYRGEIYNSPSGTTAQLANDNYRDANFPNPVAPEPSSASETIGSRGTTAFMQRRIYTIDMDSGKIY